MLNFSNDYLRGVHPAILQKLIDINMEQTAGYGFDIYTNMAKNKIKTICNCEEAEIFFLQGGTQTNKIAIAGMISHYQGVLCPQSAHISVNEAGAIEELGCKVIALGHNEGKVSAETIDEYIEKFYRDESHIHKVHPGMVFISQPTEYGTIYTKTELEEIAHICKKWQIPLYIDGARLIYALASKDNDVSLNEIAKYADVFYIGGTKAGLLFGEALVFTKNNAPKGFTTIIKRYGGLLAKGRTVGVQFNEIFTNDLYKSIGKNAVEKADKIKRAFKEKGYKFYIESNTIGRSKSTV